MVFGCVVAVPVSDCGSINCVVLAKMYWLVVLKCAPAFARLLRCSSVAVS